MLLITLYIHTTDRWGVQSIAQIDQHSNDTAYITNHPHNLTLLLHVGKYSGGALQVLVNAHRIPTSLGGEGGGFEYIEFECSHCNRDRQVICTITYT